MSKVLTLNELRRTVGPRSLSGWRRGAYMLVEKFFASSCVEKFIVFFEM
jgi:hypothetical protein